MASTKKRDPKAQKRMKSAVAYMQEYMRTYSELYEFSSYRDETFIDDVLYSLGIALGGDKYKYAKGFDLWKKKLKKHLEAK